MRFETLTIILLLSFSGTQIFAQPRVSVWARSLDRPVAILSLADGRILAVQENGQVLEFDSQGGRASSPWFRLWPDRTANRVIGARVLRESPRLQVVFYLALATSEGKIIGRLTTVEESIDEQGSPSRYWAATLLDDLPGGESRMGGAMVVKGGYLFLGTGTAGDDSLAQDDLSLGGKILRLSLLDGPLGPVQPEIWAKGFNSVQGLSFHADTDLLYAADLGPRPPLARNWDEVNLIQRGINYGYPEVFGGRGSAGFQAPVVHSTGVRLWDPADLASIGSGPWANSLVWTGLETQSLFRISVDPREPTKVLFFEQLLARAHGRLRALAVLDKSQLLVGTWNSTPESPNSDSILLVRPR